MRVRLSKEIRELFPAFAITLLSVGASFVILGARAEVFTFLAIVLGSATMGGLSFGTEFQRRTFPVLLSQPVPRSVLWHEKMLVLGGALAVIATFTLTLGLTVFHSKSDDAAALVLVPLCAFSGAPLLTLLSRNGVAGGVFAIALPGVLIACLLTVLSHIWSLPNPGDVVVGTLLAYCCAAYVLGYRVFGAIQAIEGGGTELSLPFPLKKCFAPSSRPVAAKRAGSAVALLTKELHLQQISFLSAALYVLIALVGALLIWVRPDNREWAEWIIGADFFIYIFLLPLLVGAVAFAEERSWGLLEWQLAMPPSAFRQWLTKLATTLPVSFILGVLLPVILSLIGWQLFGKPNGRGLLEDARPVILICLGQLLLTSMAAYAGSFSTNTLKAILFPVGMLLVAAFASKLVIEVTASVDSGFVQIIDDPALPLWIFMSGCLIGLVCLFQWFCFRNFRRSCLGPKNMLRQSAVAFGLFAVMASVFAHRYTNIW